MGFNPGARWVTGVAAANRFPTNGQGGASATATDSELAANKPLTITGATWTQATRTLTKTGLFAEYTFAVGDRVIVASGTGATTGTYIVQSRTSANAIVLQTALGAGADGQTDIAGSLAPLSPSQQVVTILGIFVSVGAAAAATVCDGLGTAIPGLTITLASSSTIGWFPFGPEGVRYTGGNVGITCGAGVTATLVYLKG